jgi:hypothetical protein
MAMLGYTPQQQSLFNPYQQGKFGPEPVKQRSGIGKFFLGQQEQFQRHPTQTPQAMSVLEQLLSSGSQGLQNPYAGFEPIANQARSKFQSQTIPGIVERFTSLGGSDTRGSSDFGGTLSSAGSELEQALSALQAQYGLQNRQGLLSQIGLGLTPQFETEHRPGTGGFLQSFLSGLGGAGEAAAKGFGGEIGKGWGQRASGSSGNNDQMMQMLLKMVAGV